MLDRSRPLNRKLPQSGPVLYWLNRDQRAADNWALQKAQTVALEFGQPVLVVFCLQREFLGATGRHFAFMLAGLRETARQLADLQIPFVLAEGDPGQVVPDLAARLQAGLVVCDFSPLRLPRQWRAVLAERAEAQDIAVLEVDAHNIVPVWEASPKLEFAARTIRPKINRQLEAWLTEPPALQRHPHAFSEAQAMILRQFGWQGWPSAAHDPLDEALAARLTACGGEDPLLLPGGPVAATRRLQAFIDLGLPRYGQRNDPNQPVTSSLSPYLHFGQVSAQRVAWEVSRDRSALPATGSVEDPAADFLEELVVRRELSDNFCFYNPQYDSFDGFPDWARQTLNRHRQDPRAWRYTDEQLACGLTHDNLWNAAQQDLVAHGSMPGYLRMYWAKKLLEWCASPEQAQQVAIDLNDTYALDGRDPNGYTGIAWSIGGVHDRPWGERAVFGTIRFMSYDGCKRKFSIDDYVRQVARNLKRPPADRLDGAAHAAPTPRQLSFDL